MFSGRQHRKKCIFMKYLYLLDAVLAEGLELAVNRVDPPLYRFHLLPGRIRHPFQLLQTKR
jgi:hypothetical protein